MGAEPLSQGGVHFRVWAPRRETADVVLVAAPTDAAPDPATERVVAIVPLQRGHDGYFAGTVDAAGAGSLYRLRLDGEGHGYPDPASRFQPAGPHGPSRVVDPTTFAWSDQRWRGASRQGQVLYEMHIGAFTPDGTWDAARRELPALAETGITLLEVMPVNEFAGRYGWGYDGVDPFAPTRLYGEPDDMRRFVDAAHALGMGVILDVVYNHMGPDGCYLAQFASAYFSDRYRTDWGDAINFDGPDAGPVREFFLANAAYWVDEFHLDGLRLDATQNIYDAGEPHILREIGERVRAAARGRATIVVAENEPQESRLVHHADRGGHGLDAIWNDDFHHAAMVALTGRREAYYADYRGTPQEFVSMARHGFLYQGQRYAWQGKPRGTPALDLAPEHTVCFLQNHDQIANSLRGARGHQLGSPARWRALTALLLLAPGTPMLFMGQEFAASSPFLFFADHTPELAATVRRGRAEFLRQFPSLAGPDARGWLPDPADAATFRRCKLDPTERERHRHALDLHRDLLRMRRDEPLLRAPAARAVDAAGVGERALALRYLDRGGADRLLLVNIGPDLRLDPAPEPLLAPPGGARWMLRWSSEDPRYGGGGTPPVWPAEPWTVPAECALFYAAEGA